MFDFLKKQLHEIKDKGEDVGIIFFILGFLLLVILFVLLLFGRRTEIAFVSIAIGLMSFGLGFAAIGISAKADKRYTEMLNNIYTNTVNLVKVFDRGQDKIEQPIRNVIVEVPTIEVKAEVMPPEVTAEKKSKEVAQKRLDEDTKRVGYVRGEVYQLEDGSWGIAWGGKYPL